MVVQNQALVEVELPDQVASAMPVPHKNLVVEVHLELKLKMVTLVVQEDQAEQVLDYPKEIACLEPEEEPQQTPLPMEVQQVVVVHYQQEETEAHLAKPLRRMPVAHYSQNQSVHLNEAEA